MAKIKHLELMSCHVSTLGFILLHFTVVVIKGISGKIPLSPLKSPIFLHHIFLTIGETEA